MSDERCLSIAEIAALTGLSTDTLRWYEREGILPPVSRSKSGHRRYGPRERDLVLLLSALRDAGMSTAAMKEFGLLLAEGAASHGRRITLLEETREKLDQQRRRIDQTAAALERKIKHYEDLISAGLDCDGAPVSADVQTLQAVRV